MSVDIERSILDRRSVMKGALGVGVAAATATLVADRAGAATVALDPSPGAGVANRAALQAAIDATGVGEVLRLPSGTFEVDVTSASITIPRSMTIAGLGGEPGTVIDVLPKSTSTMRSLFVVPSTVAVGHFRFEQLTIEGPTSTSGGGAAVEWVRLGGKGSISAFLVRIRGQFQYGIRRSGVGLVEAVACEINARGAAIHVTDNGSNAGPSRIAVAGSVLSGHGAATGVSGIDTQPHIALQCGSTRFEHLSGTAVNAQSGVPTPISTWSLTDCEVIDAGIITTGPNSRVSLTRVTQSVAPTWPTGETILRGPVTFTDCDLRGGGTFTVPSGSDAHRRFVSCWFEPRTFFLVMGNASGRFTFDDCTWKLTGGARALLLTSIFTGAVRFRRSKVFDCGTTAPYTISQNGGTITYTDTTVDSPKANGGIITGPAATVVGAPIVASTGTCPASPAQ